VAAVVADQPPLSVREWAWRRAFHRAVLPFFAGTNVSGPHGTSEVTLNLAVEYGMRITFPMMLIGDLFATGTRVQTWNLQ